MTIPEAIKILGRCYLDGKNDPHYYLKSRTASYGGLGASLKREETRPTFFDWGRERDARYMPPKFVEATNLYIAYILGPQYYD